MNVLTSLNKPQSFKNKKKQRSKKTGGARGGTESHMKNRALL